MAEELPPPTKEELEAFKKMHPEFAKNVGKKKVASNQTSQVASLPVPTPDQLKKFYDENPQFVPPPGLNQDTINARPELMTDPSYDSQPYGGVLDRLTGGRGPDYEEQLKINRLDADSADFLSKGKFKEHEVLQDQLNHRQDKLEDRKGKFAQDLVGMFLNGATLGNSPRLGALLASLMKDKGQSGRVFEYLGGLLTGGGGDSESARASMAKLKDDITNSPEYQKELQSALENEARRAKDYPAYDMAMKFAGTAASPVNSAIAKGASMAASAAKDVAGVSKYAEAIAKAKDIGRIGGPAAAAKYLTAKGVPEAGRVVSKMIDAGEFVLSTGGQGAAYAAGESRGDLTPEALERGAEIGVAGGMGGALIGKAVSKVPQLLQAPLRVFEKTAGKAGARATPNTRVTSPEEINLPGPLSKETKDLYGQLDNLDAEEMLAGQLGQEPAESVDQIVQRLSPENVATKEKDRLLALGEKRGQLEGALKDVGAQREAMGEFAPDTSKYDEQLSRLDNPLMGVDVKKSPQKVLAAINTNLRQGLGDTLGKKQSELTDADMAKVTKAMDIILKMQGRKADPLVAWNKQIEEVMEREGRVQNKPVGEILRLQMRRYPISPVKEFVRRMYELPEEKMPDNVKDAFQRMILLKQDVEAGKLNKLLQSAEEHGEAQPQYRVFNLFNKDVTPSLSGGDRVVSLDEAQNILKGVNPEVPTVPNALQGKMPAPNRNELAEIRQQYEKLSPDLDAFALKTDLSQLGEKSFWHKLSQVAPSSNDAIEIYKTYKDSPERLNRLLAVFDDPQLVQSIGEKNIFKLIKNQNPYFESFVKQRAQLGKQTQREATMAESQRLREEAQNERAQQQYETQRGRLEQQKANVIERQRAGFENEQASYDAQGKRLEGKISTVGGREQALQSRIADKEAQANAQIEQARQAAELQNAKQGFDQSLAERRAPVERQLNNIVEGRAQLGSNILTRLPVKISEPSMRLLSGLGQDMEMSDFFKDPSLIRHMTNFNGPGVKGMMGRYSRFLWQGYQDYGEQGLITRSFALQMDPDFRRMLKQIKDENMDYSPESLTPR